MDFYGGGAHILKKCLDFIGGRLTWCFALVDPIQLYLCG